MTIRSDDLKAPVYQRRIGKRYPIVTDFTWSTIPTGRWKRKVTTTEATTDNVSLSGLGFEAATRKDLTRGVPLRITKGDVVCDAVIRMVRPGTKAHLTYYGVEFRDQAMVDAMDTLIEEYERAHRAAEADPRRDYEFPSVNQYYIDDAY